MISRESATSGVDAFDAVMYEVLHHSWRRELEVDEIPAPQRIAPMAVAIAADVTVGGVEHGNGRLILLHDPAGNEAWQGEFRCVTFARAQVDLAMVTDPLLAEVGWSWLTDALEQHNALYTAASGTVTAVSSRCFGTMAAEPDRAEVEIRASWTPLLSDANPIGAHLDAWQELLSLTTGLPPADYQIVMLAQRPRGRQR